MVGKGHAGQINHETMVKMIMIMIMGVQGVLGFASNLLSQKSLFLPRNAHSGQTQPVEAKMTTPRFGMFSRVRN